MIINFPASGTAGCWALEGCCDMVLLDILNHFSNPLDACLDLDNVISDFHVIRFGANGVGLPQHFLNQEIEFFAVTKILSNQFIKLLDMASKPDSLFGDITFFRKNTDFFYDVRGVN